MSVIERRGEEEVMAVRTMKVIVSMVASAVLAAVCALPANATQLHDSNADVSTLRSQSVAGVESNATAMPDNPSMELPDSIASNIPDDAEVVSEGHALTSDGELKNLETGITVTDPKLVGTRNTQPDPLAKTDGESFIPVEAGTVKRKVDAVVTTPNITADFMGKTFVHTASLPNNEYGAHWGTYNGTSAFFESDNTLFAQQAKGVIDVSEWQGGYQLAGGEKRRSRGRDHSFELWLGQRIRPEGVAQYQRVQALGHSFRHLYVFVCGNLR